MILCNQKWQMKLQNRFQKIWVDPVWSKVISSFIVLILTAIGTLIYNFLPSKFLVCSQSKIYRLDIVIIFLVVVFGLIMSLIMIIRHRKIVKSKKLKDLMEIQKLATKYSKNKLFYQVFKNENAIKIIFKRIGHTPEFNSLVNNMEQDSLISNYDDGCPILSKLGIEVRNYIIENKLNSLMEAN